MKAIVTGGGGFLGSAIVKRLVARGDEVAVLGRHSSYPEITGLGVMTFCGDIRAREFLKKSFKGFDTVFHVAAKAGIWGRRREYEDVNVDGTANVIEACLVNGIDTLVYTSTPSVVFNRQDLAGVDETMPYADRFLCHYAATKADAEQLVLNVDLSELKACALRPHLIWGPGDPHLIPRLLDRGRRGLLKQVGDGQNLVDISYIDNVVEAHLLAAENLKNVATAAGQAYFISQGEPVNLWDWINTLFRRFGVPVVEKKVGFKTAYLAGALLEGVYSCLARRDEPRMTRFLAEQLAKSHWFSIDKAVRDLKYRPIVSTTEGMERLVAWLRGPKKK